MLRQNGCAIPIRGDVPIGYVDELIADFAYTLWLSSAFHGNSPEEAFLTALRMLRGDPSAGLFLVPKRTLNIYPIDRMKGQ